MIASRRIRRLVCAAIGVLIAVACLDFLFPPPLERAGNMSRVVTDRHDQWLNAFTNVEGRWRFAADLDATDPRFVERLVAIEDRRFWRHPGVDPLALVRASLSALKTGRVVSGASTITMQTARLLEPRARTLGSKAVEMLRALQIERRLSKKEILELYLTLAPYGGNIEGVRAASRLYFGKEPSALTNAEQALLIALPQAPEARRPDLKPQNAAAARADILKKLAEAELLSAMDAREARAATLPGKRTPLPRIAHHATRELAMGADQHTVQSSLDQALQARAEALIRTYVEALDDKDATAAALIVETDTRKVRAAVGSSSLDRPGGWIDLTAATRSPGSTLKPFIYALAFEDGFAGPSTIIDDMPRAFGDYAPENFDRRFRGEVRVREALQHSLNLPAVAMLERIGAPRFAAVLNAVGVGVKTPQRADEEPGLAIALGGAGVTARDLAALYAALGDDGAVRSLQWTEEPGGKAAEGRRLMTAQSAARISAILADAPSLAGRAPAALSENAVRVAFKTGTSYGYRDAWAAGHGGGFTVVVWTGRADGAPRPGATGRKAAAPLLFDLFDMLERHGASGAEPGLHSDEPDAPALARFAPARQAQPPQIIFPRDGVEVYLAGAERGLALAARGGASDYAWYVDGEPLPREASSGRAVWRPARAGFYNVTVVDAEGRAARSKVRVRASG